MAIVGTGIDLVEVKRIAASIERFGDRFLQRVFTEAEIRYCRSKINANERFAARFAAKEAGMKALGTGWRGGVAWREVEVGREASGKPTLLFRGRAAEHAARLRMTRASLSITHTQEHAVAQVILESDSAGPA